MNFQLLFEGFYNVLQPDVLLLVFLGVTGGIMLGSLPGLTATMGVALLIPFTFGLDIGHSMPMLLGIFCSYDGSKCNNVYSRNIRREIFC